MKRAEVLKIKYNPPSKSYAVLLSVADNSNEKITAIPVGTKEANTISMAYDGNSFPRPFTHDLLLDIINISSIAGKRGSSNNSAYVSTKFGVNGLTQSLSKELGSKKIRVNENPN